MIAGSDMHSRHQPGTRGKLLSISDVRGNPPSQTQKLIRSGRVDKVGGLYGPAEAPCWRGTAAPDEAQGRDMASEASRRVAAWCWERTTDRFGGGGRRVPLNSGEAARRPGFVSLSPALASRRARLALPSGRNASPPNVWALPLSWTASLPSSRASSRARFLGRASRGASLTSRDASPPSRCASLASRFALLHSRMALRSSRCASLHSG